MNDITKLTDKILNAFKRLKRYLVVLFALLLLLVYGFLMYRINVLNSVQPSETDVAAQSKTTQVPYIDPALIKQIQSLQDNSVNAQALFNEARSNPFQD